MKQILIVKTGGTICSEQNDTGVRSLETKENASLLLEELFRESGSFAVGKAAFVRRRAENIFSENMTPVHWAGLCTFFGEKRHFGAYDGIIILHGTDTLSFGAAFFAWVLRDIGVPVFVVASDLPLSDPNANGGENFRSAVEGIVSGIAAGVYVCYRNADGTMYLHHAAHLLEPRDYSADYDSFDKIALGTAPWPRAPFSFGEKGNRALPEIGDNGFNRRVLYVKPYVGLDYSALKLDKVSAVLHGMYHSSSVCMAQGRKTAHYSMEGFLKRAKEKGVPVFVTPMQSAVYDSALPLLESDAIALWGLETPAAYVKLLLGVQCFSSAETLAAWMKRDTIGEFLPRV